MADIDKQDLRKLAESQAQEPWFKQGQVRYHCKRTGEAHRIHHDDDAFIVAASPATVLALLDEIATLEGLYHMHRETEERQMIELKAEVAALRMDKARLDSGCIVTWDRDEFGEEYETERRGLDLRKRIDAAMEKGGRDDG